jgi:GNAT superfamily N-acetyltransferase
MSLEIRTLNIEADFESYYPVLKQLRSTPSVEQVKLICREATAQNDFKLVAAFEGKDCVGVMGYRIIFDFTHGKHLYVDDLVVTETSRSKGIGAALLKHAEDQARLLDCFGLRLCTGVDNLGAQKFYEREGWIKRAYAFKKSLKPWPK